MELRHEVKHVMTYGEMLTLERRLETVMTPDCHYKDGVYRIRSLYFDDEDDTALYEKLDGVSPRSKFRIRFYNGDTSYVVLEKKSKISGLCKKEQLRIGESEARSLAKGDLPAALPDHGILRDLALEMRRRGLAPKTCVEYERRAFVFFAGGVRVTIDRDIGSSFDTDAFFDSPLFIPVEGRILEVKWNEFLPDTVRDAVALGSCMSSAFSKYAACRVFG